MREFPIIVPPLIEQQNFQDIVGPKVLMQDELHNETQTLTTLRDTLLPKLISGEVRVNEAKEIVSQALLN